MHSYSSRITEASPSYKLFKYRRVESFYVMRSSYRNSHWQHRKKHYSRRIKVNVTTPNLF